MKVELRFDMKKIFLLMVLLLAFCAAAWAKVTLGIERIDEERYAELLKAKRIGVFTNQSGVDSSLNRSVDLLRQKYNVTAIFVPEHGLFGAVKAGEDFGDAQYKDIPVYSLYNGQRYPTEQMLENVDLICVDIQDIGVRHYTYTSSLAYIMEVCAKAGKEVVVFDRPNPLGGKVEGPVLKPELKSFIGLYELPLRHGLTIGEFASYINRSQNIGCHLQVVPMKGYRRNMLWADTGLPWVQTSPLIPTAETALLYAVTGVIGDTNLSVGVGTAKPFYYVGAPYADSEQVKEALAALGLEGVAFREASFIPRYGVYEGELVQGVEIYLTEPKKVDLPQLDYYIIHTFKKLYGDKLKFPERGYGADGYKVDIALGETSIRSGEEPQRAFARWSTGCEAYKRAVAPYLLYR